MASANGVNPKDKIEMETPNIKMVDTNDDIDYNKEAYVVISDYVVEPNMRLITEGMPIEGMGCVNRDILITPNGQTMTSTFIPDVRLVPKMDNDGNEIGHMYINKNHRVRTDPLNHRPR